MDKLNTKTKVTSIDEEADEFKVSPHTEFESQLPYMGLHKGSLTRQQEKLVTLIASGMSIAAAGRGAGYSDRKKAWATTQLPYVQKAIDYFREETRETVKFERKNAHVMYMEAYSASSNATEMKNTTDSLCKLHGLHAQENTPQVNIQINGSKQLERLSDEELLKLAGKATEYLEPSAND